MPGPHFDVLLRSEHSHGHGGIIEVGVPGARPGPSLHHHDVDEAFHVLDGELTFQLGDDVRTAGPGTLTFVARGSHHMLANPGGGAARYLLVCTPAGFERSFARLAAQAGGGAVPERTQAPYPETIVVGPQIGGAP
jgi:mannose-6-phosphate isomerase-like protein (cupin superfamily)